MSGAKLPSLTLAAVIAGILISTGVALAATIKGNAYANTLNGTSSADTIYGYGGNDTIYGLGANDQIYGGDGADTLYGGDQEQTVAGNDLVTGENGNDIVSGGSGADRLYGGYGNDVIEEGPVDDASADTISGGPNDDRIYAGNGRNIADNITCGEGRDEAWIDSVDTISSDCEIIHKDSSEAEVTFNAPVEVEQVVQLSGNYNTDIAILESEFQLATGSIGDFLVDPPQASVAAIKSEYKESRLDFMQDTVNAREQLGSETPNELAQQTAAMQQAIQSNDTGATPILSATLGGDLEDLQTLAAQSSAAQGSMGPESGNVTIESVKIADPEALINEAQEDGSLGVEGSTETQLTMGTEGIVNEEAVPTSSEPPPSSDGTVAPEGGTFYPNHGYSYMHNSVHTGQRYTIQDHVWNNENLGFYDTYEHEVWLDFDDKKTYLTNKRTVGCFPRTTYVSSTYPKRAYRYLDTDYKPPSSCDQEHFGYTIGVAIAGYLRSDVWYTNYIRTRKGNAPGDGLVLRAQEGYRNPTDCYSVWCSSGDRRRPLLGKLNQHYYYVPNKWEWWE